MGSLTVPPAEISPNSVQWPSHFYSEARLLADKQLLLRGHPIEVLKMCKKCHWTLLLESTTVHCLRHHRHITLSASWCHQAATLVGKRCMTCIISVLWELLAANLSQTTKSNLFKSVAGQTFTIRTMFLQDVTIPLQVQNRSLFGPHKLGREKSRFQTSTSDTLRNHLTQQHTRCSFQLLFTPPSSTRRSGSKELKSCTIQSNVAGNASGNLDGYHQQPPTSPIHCQVPVLLDR